MVKQARQRAGDIHTQEMEIEREAERCEGRNDRIDEWSRHVWWILTWMAVMLKGAEGSQYCGQLPLLNSGQSPWRSQP
jgi:hypothetical protein